MLHVDVQHNQCDAAKSHRQAYQLKIALMLATQPTIVYLYLGWNESVCSGFEGESAAYEKKAIGLFADWSQVGILRAL